MRSKLTFEHDNNSQISPALGFFWVLPTDEHEREFALVSFSEAMEDIPDIGGFRTAERGHVDLWSAVCTILPHLDGYEYDNFPRGRVNWRRNDDRFLLLMDSKLFKPAVESSVLARYALPPEKTLIMPDVNCVSKESLRGRFVGAFPR